MQQTRRAWSGRACHLVGVALGLLTVLAMATWLSGCGGGGDGDGDGDGDGGSAPAPSTSTVTISELNVMMKDGQPLTVADVRPLEQYAWAHIPGSRSLPLATLDTWAATLDKSERICCACACNDGGTAQVAADRLLALGYAHVYVLGESLALWPSTMPPSTINAARLQEMMTDGQPLEIIDVRTPAEYKVNHIPGSVNLPLDSLDVWVLTLNPNQRICCVCAKGGRSWTAATALINRGFTDVYSLLGGMEQWPGGAQRVTTKFERGVGSPAYPAPH